MPTTDRHTLHKGWPSPCSSRLKAGGDELEEVADAVAEAEGMAAFGGEGFESELTAGALGGAGLARRSPDPMTTRTDHAK